MSGGGFLKTMGQKLTTGADAAGRAIKAQALKAEILIKESNIKGIKQEFGVAVYGAMEKGDQEEIARIFESFRTRTDALNAEIAAKRLEILDLERSGQV